MVTKITKPNVQDSRNIDIFTENLKLDLLSVPRIPGIRSAVFVIY